MPSLSACHARARLARAQPPADLASLFLARAQPLLPLPPASQSRQPSRCRACVDATDANSAAHSPGNSIEGQQYTTTTASHTPRCPAPSAPHGPAQPSLRHPRLRCLQSSRTSLLQRECSGSTTSEAGPTGGPACPAMPPLPTRLDRSADSSTSSRTACRVMKHDRQT